MKTLKEFDYDLWAIEENGHKRYFARVKATGEETEIDITVMRLLLSQEKQMRREYEKRQTVGTVLSLDTVFSSEELDTSAWLIDKNQDIETEFLVKSIQDEFMKNLTPNQAKIFRACMVDKVPIREYARRNGLDFSSVRETVTAIRKKFKKYYF